MRFGNLSLVSVPLLLAGLSLPPLWAVMDDEAPWRDVDTQGLNAVVLELAHAGAPVSRVVVREGEVGSVRLGDAAPWVRFRAEWIADSGDRALVGFYQVESQPGTAEPGALLEEVKLTAGGAALTPRATSLHMQAQLSVRLVDTLLVDC